MANLNIYPPIIDTTLPAFISNTPLDIPISLSNFSTIPKDQIRGIHVTIKEAISGAGVVKAPAAAENNRFYNPGLILINVNGEFANSTSTTVRIEPNEVAWVPGTLYTIQVRLSEVGYEDGMGISDWLIQNESKFSEWSIVCRTTAIGFPYLRIKRFGDKNILGTLEKSDEVYTLSASRLNFEGVYANYDRVDSSIQTNENLYSYKLTLYEDTETKFPLETSGIIIPAVTNTFNYTFKYDLVNNTEYYLVLEYETINLFRGKIVFTFTVSQVQIDGTNVIPITLDMLDYLKSLDYDDAEVDNFIKDFTNATSFEKEKETGRIAIKLYEAGGMNHTGNICLQRADSKDNFRTWTDIKIIPFNVEVVNDYPIIYDYTVESGVFYKYTAYPISTAGKHGVMNPQNLMVVNPSLREFEYSYLIGKDGKTLKMKFNSSINSYTYNVSDSKKDTIGSQYPFITRTSGMMYRTFPFSGLISFTMDAENLFMNEKQLYEEQIVDLYKERRTKENIYLYDYKREYDFREEVLKFLYDDEPKLFKSATEGNIIIRLTGVSAQPNQSLDRMISSFSATANEIAEASYENYIKYGFTTVGKYSTEFEKVTTKLGQLILDVQSNSLNIISEIVNKYDREGKNIAGQEFILTGIKDLRLTFESDPIRYRTSAGYVLGNKFSYRAGVSAPSEFFVRHDHGRVYQFDSSIILTKEDGITLNTINADGENETVHVVVDFLYEIVQKPYKDKEIESRTVKSGVGQYYNTCRPGEDIYKTLYYKYYYELETKFRRLSQLSWTKIEANPGVVIRLKDSIDSVGELHDINYTGTLNLEGLGDIMDIEYAGLRLADGSINRAPADVIVDYSYVNIEGTYKKKEEDK